MSETDWKPIETAPKDGTYVLLGNEGGTWVGEYAEVYQSGYRPANPWSPVMLNVRHMKGDSLVPTHWMPLPSAPSPQ